MAWDNNTGHEGYLDTLTDDRGRVSAWIVRCDCPDKDTWTGATWTRVNDPSEQDIARGRVYAADEESARWMYERDDIDPLLDEWHEHSTGTGPLDLLRAAAAARTAAERDMDTAIEHARRRGITWAAIGQAAGMSAQAAQQRSSRRRP